MQTRRSFVRDGSLIAAALLAKPIGGIAGQSLFTFKNSGARITFLHTGELCPVLQSETYRYLQQQKNSDSEKILLYSGRDDTSQPGGLPFDFDNASTTNEWEIVHSNGNRIGIIHAKQEGAQTLSDIDDRAAFLKNEKNCRVVVCLTSLGYMTKSGTDAIQLARTSSHIDIILDGHKNNTFKYASVVKNKLRDEVIVHSAVSDSGFGQIEIGFGKDGKRNHFTMTDTVS